MILVSGYSIELRARIVDRWRELEAKVAAPVDTTAADLRNSPATVLALLAGYAQDNIALTADKAKLAAANVELAEANDFIAVVKRAGGDSATFSIGYKVSNTLFAARNPLILLRSDYANRSNTSP